MVLTGSYDQFENNVSWVVDALAEPPAGANENGPLENDHRRAA